MKFSEAELQSTFVSEIKTYGIEHSIDADGKVWYNQKDYKIVQGIASRVTDGFYPANYYWNPNSTIQDFFIQKMSEANILFTIKEFKGKPHVVWSPSNLDQVKTILKETLNYEHEIKIREVIK